MQQSVGIEAGAESATLKSQWLAEKRQALKAQATAVFSGLQAWCSALCARTA